MKSFMSFFACLLLIGCASQPAVPERPQSLFSDALFSAPSERINADDIFALDQQMQDFLDKKVVGRIAIDGKVTALVNALFNKGQKKFAYDAAQTRNAAEVFRLRSGNCLSYTIMTAAFAKQLRLPIQFHTATFGDIWDRNNNLEFLIGHVNLTVGELSLAGHEPAKLIDFAAFDNVQGESLDDIGEDIIVAMYMNNRAAEALAKGNLDNAYWWARTAIDNTPAYLAAYNTLGVIFTRHHNLAEAEQVFRRVLTREPDNVLAISNLIQVLANLGQTEESRQLAQRLVKIQPNPPYFFFNRGLEAMKAGDYKTAKIEFTKEVNRASYNHQFHFWLALANYYLGNMDETRKQLTVAMENSPNAAQHDLYAAKLQTIKANRAQ